MCACRACRVLFVSGHTGDDTPDGFLEAGDRLLGKPFTAETLLDVVRDVLTATDESSSGEGGGAAGDRHLQAVPRSV